METLDRYLEAVGAWLPREQRADIVAELGEDLRSEIEDRQTALDRPLSDEEVLGLLKRRGHPMSVAEGYLPSQHLIGPAMLPAYWRTVTIAVSVILAIAVAVVLLGGSPWIRVSRAVPAATAVTVERWLNLSCLVTLVVIGVYYLARILQHVRRLSPRGGAAQGTAPLVAGK